MKSHKKSCCRFASQGTHKDNAWKYYRVIFDRVTVILPDKVHNISVSK